MDAMYIQRPSPGTDSSNFHFIRFNNDQCKFYSLLGDLLHISNFSMQNTQIVCELFESFYIELIPPNLLKIANVNDRLPAYYFKIDKSKNEITNDSNHDLDTLPIKEVDGFLFLESIHSTGQEILFPIENIKDDKILYFNFLTQNQETYTIEVSEDE